LREGGGSEELMVVLRGQPTLRTGEGERRLGEGEVVHFPTGPDGAHAISNETNQPVRYLMASTLASIRELERWLQENAAHVLEESS
jgi:uncharacterized cupin superfamily protein